MEKVYLPRYKKITQIESKFELFKTNISYANAIPKTDEDLQNAMQFNGSPADFDLLSDSISLDNLSQSDDIRPVLFDPSAYISRKRSIVEVPKKALKLKTVSMLIGTQSDYTERHRRRYLKYNKYKYIKQEIDNTSADIMPFDEILIAIRVYEPFPYRSNAYVSLKPKLSQEFYVLGSQYLIELRDRIYCQCRFGPFYDISDNPNKGTPSDGSGAATTEADPGFFFITDTFYNDHRHTQIDYSAVICNWMERKRVAEPKVANMAQTMFKDLTVRLGYPQLYQHHGNCEHLFTFADIRLMSASDSRVRQDYPLLRTISNSRSTFCRMCGLTEACILVINCNEHVHNPTFLCQTCFEQFHYVNGVKQGDFQAYRYYGNRPISHPSG